MCTGDPQEAEKWWKANWKTVLRSKGYHILSEFWPRFCPDCKVDISDPTDRYDYPVTRKAKIEVCRPCYDARTMHGFDDPLPSELPEAAPQMMLFSSSHIIDGGQVKAFSPVGTRGML